jgi:hypothetical protein
MVCTRVCAVIVQLEWQQQNKSPFGVLVDRSEESLAHSRMKRRVFPMMTDLLNGLPTSLLKRCHHLIHHLTCTLSFMLKNNRYHTNALELSNCSHLSLPASLDAQLLLRQCNLAVVGTAALCHIHCHTARQGMLSHAYS